MDEFTGDQSRQLSFEGCLRHVDAPFTRLPKMKSAGIRGSRASSAMIPSALGGEKSSLISPKKRDLKRRADEFLRRQFRGLPALLDRLINLRREKCQT